MVSVGFFILPEQLLYENLYLSGRKFKVAQSCRLCVRPFKFSDFCEEIYVNTHTHIHIYIQVKWKLVRAEEEKGQIENLYYNGSLYNL